jgi:hypothetical protein
LVFKLSYRSLRDKVILGIWPDWARDAPRILLQMFLCIPCVFPARLLLHLVAAAAVGLLLSIATTAKCVPGGHSDKA